MGIKSLSIILSSPNGSFFYAGSTVQGRVVIYVEKTTHVKTLELKVKGKALVYWSETHLEHREFVWETGRHHHRQIHVRDEPVMEREHRSAQEKYFSSVVPIMVDSVLHAGTREIAFSFQLPHNIPSSFKGHHGQIRYTAVANLHTDHRFIFGGHHKSKIEFNVVCPVDLNLMPQARNGVAKFVRHNFYNIVISAGDFKMTATMVHSGFTPGHPIQITVEAENDSSIKIHGMMFILKEELTWRTERPFVHTKVTTQELARTQGEGVMCNTTCSRTYMMHIPHSVHGDISNCRLISARYYLEVEALVHGLHTNPILVLEPLYVGSVPLSSHGGVPARSSVPSFPVCTPSYPAQGSGYPVQPPTYPGQNAGYPGQPPSGFPAQPGGCVPSYPGQTLQPSQPSLRPGVIPGQPPMYPSLPTDSMPAQMAGNLPQPPYRPPGSFEPPPPYNYIPSAPAAEPSYPIKR